MDNGSLIKLVVVVLLLMVIAVSYYQVGRRSVPTDPDLNEIATGYEILRSSLQGLSQLNKLLYLKVLTFRRPSPEIEQLMREISALAKETLDAMPGHLRREPAIISGPAPGLGSAIREAAKEKNKQEILGNAAQFETRFLVAQLQALMMLGVVAEQTARFDPNDERSAWLQQLKSDFWDLRGEVYAVLHSRTEGDAATGR